MSVVAKLLVLRALLALTVVALQPAAVLAQAYPGPSSTQAGARAEAAPAPFVAQAFDLLMDRFVFPPSSAALLSGGWDGALAALRERGVDGVLDDRPPFGDQRESDLRLFTNRYPRLVEAADGKLEQAELDRAIVDGMARAMNEGHTAYLPPEQVQAFLSQIRARYIGIGVSLNQERRVTEVFEGGPAESSGVHPGDHVVAVDGMPIEGLTSPELSRRLRGELGTSVELTIRREGSPDSIVFRLVRAEIKIAWLSSRILDDGVGYLKIRNFPGPDLLSDFRQAMEGIERANIRALVIDLRGNSGGSVNTGVEVASRFIRSGPLFRQVDRSGRQRTVTAFGDYWDRDVPIAVLTDGSSASMSEALASAIQENGVGIVIGTRTAGVLAAGEIHPLSDGSALSVTVAEIRSGQGRIVNGVGLEPDRTIQLDSQMLADGRDNQLDAALEYVRTAARARAAARAPSDSPVWPELLPMGA